MRKLLQTFLYVSFLGAFLVSVISCDKDDDPTNEVEFGAITGVVADGDGQPISDVTVTLSGIDEEDVSVTSAGDGTYTFDKVSRKTHAVTFSKSGWLTMSLSVSAGDFDDSGVATVNAALTSASA